VNEILNAAAEAPVDAGDAHALAALSLDALLEAASARRDRRWGRRLTFSPKVFLPLTNLCRNFCDYCSFRRSPKDDGAHTMSTSELDEWLGRARDQGCVEALFCLGDRPEAVFPSYARQLDAWGFGTTVDYLERAGRIALDAGLLPHTNAGVLTRDEMEQLRPVNASLGLMLESTSERLCDKGMPHHRAPDKRPAVRLQMTREAGELAIPFTSGILVGIGETAAERVDALLAIRDLHRRYGHIQEVIVQRLRVHPRTPMAAAPEPADGDLARTIAIARLILDDEVTVQAPPNLSPDGDSIELQLRAGINDFGGISPVTPDFINPRHRWPVVAALGERCAAAGFSLAPRLPIHAGWVDPAWVAPEMMPHLAAAEARLSTAARAA